MDDVDQDEFTNDATARAMSDGQWRGLQLLLREILGPAKVLPFRFRAAADQPALLGNNLATEARE